MDVTPLSLLPNTIRPSITSLGGASAERFRTSGHTATSTPCTTPPLRSRMSHEPSLPSISTDPDAPSLTARARRFAVRMSVSVSHRYSTSLGVPCRGSTRTATLTAFLHDGSDNLHVPPPPAHTDPLRGHSHERKHRPAGVGAAKIAEPAIG